MGKTESRKHTKPKTNTKQGEVFILTPNVLQKLGITLGDIATNQQPETEDISKDTDKNRNTKDKDETNIINSSESFHNERIPQNELVYNNKPKASSGKNSSLSLPEKALMSKTFLNIPNRLSSLHEAVSNVEETSNDVISTSSSGSGSNNANTDSSTSILETASLMKKSVFLSPSFCNTDFVNTFHDEISQESSTNDAVVIIDPKDNGIKQNLQKISLLSESFDSLYSLSVLEDGVLKIQKTSEILHNTKDELSETDDDIPLSQLKISLQTSNSHSLPKTIKLISSEDTTNLQGQTSLNSKGKNNNETIMINKNVVSSNLDQVINSKLNNVESNKDTSKTYNEISETLYDDTSESWNSHSMGELNESAASKINGECQMENVDYNLPLDNSSDSEFQLNDLHMEEVDYFEEVHTLDNNKSNEQIGSDKVIKESEGLKQNSKIKIISEEIIDSSQLKELKIPLGTHKLQLTPVSIESQILKDASCNSGYVYDKKEISEKPNVEHNLKGNLNGKDNVSESKVKEIADYLSQIIKKRNSRPIICDDIKIATNSKRNNSNSKLSAQGVEKPGGGKSIELLSHKIRKTYSHSRKIKNTKKIAIIENAKKVNLKLPAVNIDYKDVSAQANEIMQECCICSDYGKFDVYCENESYEHIHFWYHKKTVSRPEIIYSIYNEDGFIKDKPDEVNETVETDSDEPESGTICWYNIKVNDYETEHINDKEDNLPVDLNKKRLEKNTRISLKDPLEMKVNATSSSYDVEISSKKNSSHDFRKHSNESTNYKCDLNKPSTKKNNILSQSNTLSHCLITDESNMAKQRVTRNSLSIKKESDLTHENNVKDDVTFSNISPHSITRRKSIRLSLHESSTGSITKAIEAPCASATKKSPVIEVERPVKCKKNSISTEKLDINTKNKESIASETINRTKIIEALPKSVSKNSPVIDTEKPVRRTRNSASAEAVDKNTNNCKLVDSTKSKACQIIKVTSPSSANKKSHDVDKNKPVKRTRNSTSVEVPYDCEKASASSHKTPGNDKENPLQLPRISTSIEVVTKKTNKEFEQSTNSKTSDKINKSRDAGFPSSPATTKSSVIDNDKPLKRKTRSSTSVEGVSVHFEVSPLSTQKTSVNVKEKPRKCSRKSTSVEEEEFSGSYENASSTTQNTSINDKEKHLKRPRTCKSVEVAIKNTNKQFEKSTNSNTSDKLNNRRDTEFPSPSATKKSSIIENDKPVKRKTRSSTSMEEVPVHCEISPLSTQKTSANDKQTSQKCTRKSISVESLEVPDNYEKASSSSQKTSVCEKEKPQNFCRKSTSVETVENNMNNEHKQSINSMETIQKPRTSENLTMNRTRNSTSIEVMDNSSGNKINQLKECTQSKSNETLNSTKVSEAPSTFAAKKSTVIDKDKLVKCTSNSTSVVVLDAKCSNKNNQHDPSSKSKAIAETNRTKTVVSFTSATKKSPVKDKPAKRARNSTSVEGLDTKTAKNNDQIPLSNNSPTGKSLTANNNNERGKSTESQSCETRRLSQTNQNAAHDSESPATRVRQNTETGESVAFLPEASPKNIESQEVESIDSGNVETPIKQEIKIEISPQHNRDVISFDEPGVSGMAEPIRNNLTTCGVCNEVVSNESWQQHLKSHNYLAWKSTEKPMDLDDREEVKRYLHHISRTQGGLYCSKCGVIRKYPKPYLHHIDLCNGNTTENLNTTTASALDTTQESVAGTNDDSLVKTKRAKRQKVDELVKCGVCKADVWNSHWIEHIRIKHQYIAKREGEIPLDENDEEEVKSHLHNISKYYGGLICNHCGTNRRYVKVYLEHIKTCRGVVEVVANEESAPVEEKEVICAVCKMSVNLKEWYTHIQLQHQYLAWIEGQKPLNVDDPQEVLQHLQKIVKKTGQLYCWLCNEPRKLARIFLHHVELCKASGFTSKPAEQNPNLAADQFECGICHVIGKKEDWRKHAMSKHYNIAWKVGEPPINIKNIYAVDKYLKYYHAKQGSLVCKICNLSRSSFYGFYAHILVCGKSDEEIDDLMIPCEICNKKFVCIYKNQHMAAHRDAELRKEKRKREAELRKEKQAQELKATNNGKRRAAEKAQKVLAELPSDDEDGQPLIKRRRISDSDDSLKMEAEDSDDSDSMESEDSDVSDEEKDTQVRASKKAPLKIQRIPFKVENASRYLKQAYVDYQAYHFSNECLYNEWRHTQLKSVSDASKYIPTVATSCKIKWDGGQWCTFNRFDSMKNAKSLILFAGGCIQCMSWVPEDPVTDNNFYLAISTHRGPDVPRYNKNKIAVHPGLIQIWSFGELRSVPELALGLAHNFGTIWAMDWCPSGARDAVPPNCNDKTALRLGLLAVACSSGDVYIISVPQPPDVNNREMLICEAQPVVELKLNHISKRKYQATSICWTPQKGHSTVLVGYADGTTALYDLNTKSPLLKEKSADSNMTIIYPFLENKTESAPVSALSVSATLDSGRALGSVVSGGATGASVWSSAGAAPAASLRTALAARAAAAAPHWPAHRLLAEIAVSGKVVNEVDWWGGGRRLGPLCAHAACARCGAALLAAPPALRLLRAHPAHPEIKKRVLATLQMVPINAKVPQKKVKDDNAIVLQPITYKDAVGKYGLELKMISKKDNASKAVAELEQRADRFPLSDVTAASFCPSDHYHHRIAFASHAGFAFVINATN